MKKLNNKGLTLIELLISIVLIGIVLTFLVNLLSDLRNEIDNNDYAYGNQVNKTDAIYTIQRDLNTHKLLSIELNANNVIHFLFENAESQTSGTLKVIREEEHTNKNYIQYIDYNGIKHKWEMKGVTMARCATVKRHFYSDDYFKKYYFIYSLPLYTNSENNSESLNNVVDDFELTFSDYTSDDISIFTNTTVCY